VAAIRSRVAALRPGFYTRLGAAIRHTSQILAKRPSRKRLLIILTDGKPNDLDHYEGRFGIEDTRKAIEEARRAGQCVFGITIDDKAQNYFPRIFGPGAFAIVSHPNRLLAALPVLYRHLVS
jgi:nitric oxide reductase NorD protein